MKTLDFKIYLGLLTETYNEAHQEDLSRTSALPIDMVIVNLYPFAATIARERCDCQTGTCRISTLVGRVCFGLLRRITYVLCRL